MVKPHCGMNETGPTLRRIAYDLVRGFPKGWMRAGHGQDYVCWRRRERNRQADWLCNQAMDNVESELKINESVLKGCKHFNLLFFIDGGLS